MKLHKQSHAPFLGACLVGVILFTLLSASAATITQTVAGAAGTTWNGVLWGTPAAAPTNGSTYVTPSAFDVRTPDSQTASTFFGDQLQINGGGRLVLKNGGASNGMATANLVLNGGSITYNTANGTTVSAIKGTLQVPASSVINSVAGASTRDIWLFSDVSGSGNLTVAMGPSTFKLALFGSNSAFSGNWTNTSGFIEVGNGSVNPLGSGSVTLLNTTNALSLNTTNDLVLNNVIGGAGAVTKRNSGTVVLTGNNTFTGNLISQMGTLVLTGTGTQGLSRVDSNAVLRVANSGALPPGFLMRVNSFDAQTGRLELSNNITVATGLPIELGMRGNITPALQNIHGNNVINDAISISSGGILAARIQADAGTSLELAGGITSGATGTRIVGLQGDGTGLVSGFIDNGSATTLSVAKSGSGTWTLNGFNLYSGTTVISNGVLKLGAGASIASSSLIHVEAPGVLNATLVPGGLALNSSQILRGNGTVAGAVSTAAGSSIEVGVTNQFGPLAIGGALTLNGGDTLRFDVASATNDVLQVSGALTLNGPTTVMVSVPAGFVDNGTYRLINYSGTIQGGGSFALVPPSSRQIFALDTATAGQVNLVVTGNPTNLLWSGDGSANVWDVGVTPNWNFQADVFYNADNVTFNDAGSASPDISLPAAVSPTSVTVSNTAQAYTFTGAGIVTGAFTKRGNNVVALANDGNNFSGPVKIEAGVLSLGNGGSTGNWSGSAAITNNGQFLVNKSSVGVNVNGAISGTGSVRLTGGGASINLVGSNSYAGPTTIEAGCQLSVVNNSALGDTNTGTVVQPGGRVGFTVFGNWTVAEPLEIAGFGIGSGPGALYANTTSNRVTWTAPVTVAGDAQIRLVNNGVRMILSGTVIGTNTALQCSPQDTGSVLGFLNTLSIGNGTLTKDGAGTVLLASSSNLAGATVINGGSVQVTTTTAPHIGDVTVNTGSLQIGDGGANGALPDGFINLAGAGTTLVFNSSNNFTINKELSGAGGLSKLNDGTLTITSSNSFTGNITTGAGTPVLGGPIRLFNSHGLGDGVAAKMVTLTRAELQLQGGLDIPAAISFTTSGGALSNTPGGYLIPIRNVTGNNAVEGNITLGGGGGDTVISVDSGTLTLNGNVSPSTAAASRALILGGAGTGILNGALNDNGAFLALLTKQEPGTWTLNNVNNYTGVTAIQNGTLVLGASASIANTPSIQLSSNAVLNVSAVSGGFTLGAAQTLKGSGTVVGSVAATGTVAPGTSVGTLNFSSTLVLGGFTVMELNSTNAQKADLVSAAGVTLGGELTVTNIGPDLQGGEVFKLFDGAISGAFTATNLPALSSTNLTWDTSLLGSQGIIKVASNVAPAPVITPSRSGNNLVLQVASEAGFNYIVEATAVLAPATWAGVQTNAGGGPLTFTIPINSATPKQFFRVRVQ